MECLGGAPGSEEIKKNARELHSGALGCGGLGNSVWNKHPAEFQVSMIQRIFVYGNPERLISLLRTRSVWWCGAILSYKYLPVQILGSITCYYSLKGDILTGSGAGWGSFIENIWNISPKIYRWSPLLSPCPTFLFWSDKSCIYLSNTC